MKIYKEWVCFLERTKSILNLMNFKEVRTPNLVPSPAMESTLFGFKVESTEKTKNGEDFFLPTSPEFSLKKLWLSGEFPKIFEIAASYRAEEENTALHLPEFNMLEYYEAEVTKENFLKQTEKIIKDLLGCESLQFERVKLNELFKTVTGFEITPQSDESFLKKVLDFHSLHYTDEYDWNDLYQVLYIDLLEPSLSQSELLLLENFPPRLAALAKINEKGWADRFEVMFGGIEIGNGYNELLDVIEHKRRWSKKHPVDHDLMKTLESTKVKSGFGIAIGMERLFFIKKRLQQEPLDSIKVWPF